MLNRFDLVLGLLIKYYWGVLSIGLVIKSNTIHFD